MLTFILFYALIGLATYSFTTTTYLIKMKNWINRYSEATYKDPQDHIMDVSTLRMCIAIMWPAFLFINLFASDADIEKKATELERKHGGK
jgi:hypothetical protein